MAKIVCVLYEDPVTGYPRTYARDDIPNIERYPGGQTTPTPKSIDFRPGQLLGSVSGELGLRKFLESQGHTLVSPPTRTVRTVFEKELVDAEVVISQPFWPAYLTAEPRLASCARDYRRYWLDHVDSGSDAEGSRSEDPLHSISVSEHVVMMIALVRTICRRISGNDVVGTSPIASRARTTLEGMNVGTVAAGRIGTAVLGVCLRCLFIAPTGIGCPRRLREN